VLLDSDCAPDPQGDDLAPSRLSRKGNPELVCPPAVRNSEVEVQETPAWDKDVRLEGDIPADDGGGQDQRGRVGGDLRPA
jgi:hypothetical protein